MVFELGAKCFFTETETMPHSHLINLDYKNKAYAYISFLRTSRLCGSWLNGYLKFTRNNGDIFAQSCSQC